MTSLSANSRYPDFSGNCIVNLVQTLAVACGSADERYPRLAAQFAGLSVDALADARQIVLLIIDGLGQRQLDRFAAEQALRTHRVGTLNSVFPSTTAAAIPAFMTGLAPAQHGLTGWHIQLEEAGEALAILPLTSRAEPKRPLPADLVQRICTYPTLYQQLRRESWVVAPQHIAGTPFNAWHSRGATTLAYTGVDGLFATLTGLLGETPAAASPRRLVYAYFPDLDSASHRFGTDSAEAQQTLAAFDAAFGRLIDDLRGSDTWLIVTADHGFIDSPDDRVLCLDDHPQLAAWLACPLSGESRAAYAHVLPAHRADFADYVRRHLAHCIELRTSFDLIAAGWFGPPPIHPRLAARVGDYTLLMKDNWTIKDWLPGEKRFRLIGVHGGISDEEIYVPLVAVRV
jgi:hypothetical protein